MYKVTWRTKDDVAEAMIVKDKVEAIEVFLAKLRLRCRSVRVEDMSYM